MNLQPNDEELRSLDSNYYFKNNVPVSGPLKKAAFEKITVYLCFAWFSEPPVALKEQNTAPEVGILAS